MTTTMRTGSRELHAGVQRRRWVLAALAFLMLGAVIMGLVLALLVAPSITRGELTREQRLAAVTELAARVNTHEQAALSWLASRDDAQRAELNSTSQAIDAQATVLSNLLTGSDRTAALQVLSTNGALRDVDNQLAQARGADPTSPIPLATIAHRRDAASALQRAVDKVRSTVEANALQATQQGARDLRWVALLLLTPLIPTAWVFYLLVKGVRQIRDVGQQMLAASSEVSSSAAQLSAASEELAATSVEGSASFAEAMATIDELAKAADGIASSVDGVAGQSQDMRANLERAGADIQESSRRMVALADRVNEISSITALINEIADQTNLLALNAAIEAARAGEGGKGFAVVAEEVRRLAERSKTSSAKIANIVDSAQTETAATVMAMEKGAKQMEHAMAFMDTVADASSQGRLSAAQHRAATQQVVITFEQLTGNTKSVSATTHQIAASAVGLANLAKQLEVTAASSAAGV
jgi:uncharacterized protein YoxC